MTILLNIIKFDENQKLSYKEYLVMKRVNLTNKEAAEYIGCAPSTLKQSRSSEKLFGKVPPKHLKMGTSVRYKLSTLDEWMSQFTERSNTMQTDYCFQFDF